jgi:hypothetical protein
VFATPAFRARNAALLAAGDLLIVVLLGWYLINA